MDSRAAKAVGKRYPDAYINESICNRAGGYGGGGDGGGGGGGVRRREEEGSRRIEIEDSIFAGSMLISGVESCDGNARDWSARVAAPFCSFSREPPIYMWSNLATIVICQPAPTLLRLGNLCHLRR